jgi:hypothetical protein
VGISNVNSLSSSEAAAINSGMKKKTKKKKHLHQQKPIAGGFDFTK